MRKISSLTALISFLLVILNSVVLYIAPHGRIAYWADWRFLGLTKTEWANQHIIVGVLFLLAIFLHTYYNWKSIVVYLKNKAKKVRIFTREFNIALFIVVIFTIGAYVEIAPFRWVLTFSESVKETAAQNYGEPPYGRAELSSLENFAAKTGIEVMDGLTRLRQEGIQIQDEQQTLLDIAKLNNSSPQQLYQWMKTGAKHETENKIPEEPAKGFGNRKLTDVCLEYGLDISAVVAALVHDGIETEPGATIKQIAAKNDMTPQDIFTAISKAATSN